MFCLRQRRLQLGEQFLARLDVGVVKLVGPQRAGIIDIDVDIAGGQRIEDHVGAEALARSGRQVPPPAAAARSAPTAHIARRRSWRRRCSSTARAPSTAPASPRPAPRCRRAPSATRTRLRRANAGFDQRQQLIDRERQHRRGEAAEQHEHPVLGLQPGEDVIAEAGLADRRRQRRGADHPDRRGADARHDHRQRQRQFDHEQRLPRRHADALRRLERSRIDALQAGDGVAQHRQHRIERQRQHRRQEIRTRRSRTPNHASDSAASASSSG